MSGSSESSFKGVNIPLIYWGFFALTELFSIILAAKFSLVVLGSIIAILYLYYSFKNSFFGLCNIILLHIFILKQSEAITFVEVFFGLYFLVVISGWFFKKIFLKGERILVDNIDYYLFIFLLICVSSIIPAILFNVSLLKWFRELIPLLTYVLFFLVVDLVKEKKQFKIIALCFLLLSLYVAVHNLILYKKSVSSAIQFWQVVASRVTYNEPLFFTIITVAVCILIFSKSLRTKLLMGGIISFFSIALIVTFSRGYWIATLLSVLVVFFIISIRMKLKIIGYSAALVLIGLLIIIFFFGNLGTFIINAIEERFETLGEIRTDISFLNRLVESKAVLSFIKLNPIIGYGLGKTYIFRPLIPREMPTWYVHNGYLYLVFKVGMIGLFFIMAFFLRVIYNGYLVYRGEKDSFYKALTLGIISLFIAMIPLSVSSPQFHAKDSALIIAFGAGIIEAIKRRKEQIG